MKGLRKLPALNAREREIVALRANGLEIKQIADELWTNEQTIKNISRRARQKWEADDDDDGKMTQNRFLALAIVTEEIVWDRSVSKFVPLDELL